MTDIYRIAGQQSLAQDEANWERAAAAAKTGGRSCTSKKDCPPGKVCDRQAGRCVEERPDRGGGGGGGNDPGGGTTPGCTSSSQCPSGSACVNGRCQVTQGGGGRECNRNSDCPSGKVCSGGRCQQSSGGGNNGGGNNGGGTRPPTGGTGSTQNTNPPPQDPWANGPVGITGVGDNLPNYGNSWFGNIPFVALKNWAEDPSQVAYAFARNQGWGRGTDTLLNQWANGNPYDVLYGLGYGDQIGFNYPSRINAASDLWKSITTGPNYVDPRQIMRNLVNISVGEAGTNNPWETLLADPSLTPQQQVQQVISYIGSVMQGIMPTDALQAYMMQLNNVARRYIQFASENPTSAGTFVKYIGQVLGPYGGLG